MSCLRRRRVCILLCLLALLLSGCDFRGWLFDERDEGGLSNRVSPSPSASPAIPSGPATIDLYGLAWNPVDRLDPFRDKSVWNHVFYPLVYEGLFVLDASFAPQPVLCSFVSDEENRVFTFALRAGVTFHDGAPLTAADVLASFEQARADGSPYAAALSGVVSVEAGEGMVVVTLDASDARFPALCTFPIARSEDSEMGTGPYRMDRSGETPALSLYGAWWQNKPLSVLHWELIDAPTPDQVLSAFESGSVTVLPLDPSGEGQLWIQSASYESFSYATAQMIYVGLNAQETPMNRIETRRAIALCLDRDAWIQALLEDRADAAFLPVPPAASFAEGMAQRTNPDEKQAKDLLEQAGWFDRDGDGWLDNANRFTGSAPLRLLVSRDKPLRVSLARSLAGALAQIGLAAEVVPLAAQEFQKELNEGRFDLYVGETALSADFDPAVFLEGGALGYGCARNDDLEALLAAAQAAPSTQSRLAWRDFWRQWQAESVILPVCFRRMELAAARGSLNRPTPLWGNLFYDIAGWS